MANPGNSIARRKRLKQLPDDVGAETELLGGPEDDYHPAMDVPRWRGPIPETGLAPEMPRYGTPEIGLAPEMPTARTASAPARPGENWDRYVERRRSDPGDIFWRTRERSVLNLQGDQSPGWPNYRTSDDVSKTYPPAKMELKRLPTSHLLDIVDNISNGGELPMAYGPMMEELKRRSKTMSAEEKQRYANPREHDAEFGDWPNALMARHLDKYAASRRKSMTMGRNAWNDRYPDLQLSPNPTQADVEDALYKQDIGNGYVSAPGGGLMPGPTTKKVRR